MKIELKGSDTKIETENRNIYCIHIWDNVCWRCKGNTNLTGHHAIPQYLIPKMNVIVPLCRKCHDDLHREDRGALMAYTYKIMKSVKTLLQHLRNSTFTRPKP
jgi:hypothetical protein